MLFGDKMDGEYMGLDSDIIRLKIDGEERVYPRKDIAEIRLLKINDPNQNGVGIGLAIGAATLAFVAYGATGGEYYSKVGPLAAGIGAGVGALIGYLVDNSYKGSELIYRAPNSK